MSALTILSSFGSDLERSSCLQLAPGPANVTKVKHEPHDDHDMSLGGRVV